MKKALLSSLLAVLMMVASLTPAFAAEKLSAPSHTKESGCITFDIDPGY